MTVMLMGGGLGMFYSDHAVIVIFGGSFAATLIRFPLSSIFHGLPLGMKFVFSMRRISQRELVDEIAGLAEIARKQGPIGLEKVEIEDPFLAKGIRFVADGYEAEFIRDNLERDRDNFLQHLDEGQKIYRAIGDCAPAFGMIGTLIGMVQMFANMTDPSKLGPFMATALLATLYGAVVANILTLPIADKLHLKLVDEEINRTLIIDGILMIREFEEPDAGARNADRIPAGKTPGHGAGAGSGLAAKNKTMARRKEAHGGGHGWFVTFADLMGLLVSFFVMLVAFSNQDQQKLQIVAGSMRDAFGTPEQRALFRHHRSRRSADTSQAKERGAHHARGRVRHADARSERARSPVRRQIREGSGLCVGRGVAAPGAGRHAGPHRGQ